MNQLNQLAQRDPLQFKSRHEPSTTKRLYTLLAVIPAFFLLSLVFYIIANTTELKDLPQATKMTSDETIDNQELSGEGVKSNFPEQSIHQTLLDNATSSKITVIGEVFTDRTKIADSFSKIQIGLRIMPSQNDEAGMIIMKTTDEANHQDSKLNTKVDIDDNHFLMTQTSDYFPVLRVSQENGPIGSASPLCIHLNWAKQEHKKMIDQYRSIIGFPNCTNAFNSKYRWQKSDPKTGVDFKAWKQHITKVESESDCKKMDGIFIKNRGNQESGKCFTYQVLERVCLMVAFKIHPKTNSYYWEYRGGCYSDGDIGIYEKAAPGTDYKFDSIPIEVREDESLYVAVGNVGSQARNIFSPIFYFITYTFLTLGILSSLAFVAIFFIKRDSDIPNIPHQEQVDDQ